MSSALPLGRPHRGGPNHPNRSNNPRNKKPHDVYRLYAECGQLIYIGMSFDATMRIRQHASGKKWGGEIAGAQVDRFPNRDAARHAEDKAIRDELPKYNKLGLWNRDGQGSVGLRIRVRAGCEEEAKEAMLKAAIPFMVDDDA